AIVARICALLFDDAAADHHGSLSERSESKGAPAGPAADAGRVGPQAPIETSPPNHPRADWSALEHDYARIRTHIERVIPGFDDFEARVDRGRTLMLPNGPRDSRTFPTATGKARFTVNELEFPQIPEGRVLLQTLRS